MFWYLVVAATAIGAAYYRWSRRRLYRLARELPTGGVKAYPIVGHAYKFLGTSEDRMKTIQLIGDIANGQGGLMSGWLTNKLFVGLTDPKSIEVVTKACLDKDEFTMKFTRTVIGYGAIFAPEWLYMPLIFEEFLRFLIDHIMRSSRKSSYDHHPVPSSDQLDVVKYTKFQLNRKPGISMWHTRRKIMAPFFGLKNLHRLVPVFNEKSSIMADLMRPEAEGGDFSIWKYITTYTFDSVCETAVGITINSQKDPDFHVLTAINKVQEMVCDRILRLWMHPDFIYKKLPIYKTFSYHRDQLNSFVDKIVQKRRKEFAAVDAKTNEAHRNDLTCYLDLLIQSSGGEEKGYTDMELREEVLVMLIAGNDTSAASASFTAVLLSRYPEIQDKVYQELLEVFGDSDRAVTPEDLSRLKYLEAVIKESLRLYPPAAVVVREVHNDVALPSGSTLVDGTSIVLNIWGTHRNPQYWGADAELFRPERFLEGPLRHPAQFIPFSYSLRNCVGYTYAMLSMKTGLANLLRRYKLLPPANMAAADLKKPLRVFFEITIKAVGGYTLRVEKRNKIL